MLHFGGTGGVESEAEITASSSGHLEGASDMDAALVVESVVAITDDGLPWLAVNATSVDANGLGRYRVSVDRRVVAGSGEYSGRIVLTSNLNDIEVPVTLEVEAALGATVDAGRHYVLLLDPATGETLRTSAAEAVDGVYPYEFEALSAGEYEIVTGSDRDNDGSICDVGEACGAYPSLDAVQAVRIDRDRSGLDFETSLGFGPP